MAVLLIREKTFVIQLVLNSLFLHGLEHSPQTVATSTTLTLKLRAGTEMQLLPFTRCLLAALFFAAPHHRLLLGSLMNGTPSAEDAAFPSLTALPPFPS